MTKAKRAATVPVAEIDPMQEIAERLFYAEQRRLSPELAWLKQLDKDKAVIRELYKSGRNAPFEVRDKHGSVIGRVVFVQQPGKSKSVCALAHCGNIGLRNQPEWHCKAQAMIAATSA